MRFECGSYYRAISTFFAFCHMAPISPLCLGKTLSFSQKAKACGPRSRRCGGAWTCHCATRALFFCVMFSRGIVTSFVKGESFLPRAKKGSTQPC